ncbi:hypothetical protein G6011_00875 [Alternaria panax]|uniref:Uncharacterized protein n=1 Tax=Alternaria panax TaxID=48097 RepID=A0AAD4IK25_9PLEO|nr:hypothetical protein G6011_00875 [Alternaria panax]
MTTYYHYDLDGKVRVSNPYPAAGVSTTGPLVADAYERQGDIVGAFLARRGMKYPAPGVSGVQQSYGHSYHPPMAASKGSVDGEPIGQSHQPNDGDEYSGYTASSSPEVSDTLGWAGWASHSGVPRPYPNPEDIRHLHTLQNLLPYLQPERKLNALDGPVVDIVEQDTGATIAYQVPKKMLVLFLGRKLVNKFIRTTQREDNSNWRGAPTCQVMALPKGAASQAAMKILIAWMFRACQYQTMGSMRQIRIPKNTFVACSLARTMELFELHKDALRVDHYIATTGFVRPIFAVELETLWNCLGKESRYVYAAINVVGRRLRAFDAGSTSREFMGIDEDMLAMLKEYADLEARVRDPELNEQHRPCFSTEWIKRLDDKQHENRHQKLDESTKHPDKFSSKDLEDEQPARDLEEEPESVELETTARKLAILRTVPETTEPVTGDPQRHSNPDQDSR